MSNYHCHVIQFRNTSAPSCSSIEIGEGRNFQCRNYHSSSQVRSIVHGLLCRRFCRPSCPGGRSRLLSFILPVHSKGLLSFLRIASTSLTSLLLNGVMNIIAFKSILGDFLSSGITVESLRVTIALWTSFLEANQSFRREIILRIRFKWYWMSCAHSFVFPEDEFPSSKESLKNGQSSEMEISTTLRSGSLYCTVAVLAQDRLLYCWPFAGYVDTLQLAHPHLFVSETEF